MAILFIFKQGDILGFFCWTIVLETLSSPWPGFAFSSSLVHISDELGVGRLGGVVEVGVEMRENELILSCKDSNEMAELHMIFKMTHTIILWLYLFLKAKTGNKMA